MGCLFGWVLIFYWLGFFSSPYRKLGQAHQNFETIQVANFQIIAFWRIYSNPWLIIRHLHFDAGAL